MKNSLESSRMSFPLYPKEADLGSSPQKEAQKQDESEERDGPVEEGQLPWTGLSFQIPSWRSSSSLPIQGNSPSFSAASKIPSGIDYR